MALRKAEPGDEVYRATRACLNRAVDEGAAYRFLVARSRDRNSTEGRTAFLTMPGP